MLGNGFNLYCAGKSSYLNGCNLSEKMAYPVKGAEMRGYWLNLRESISIDSILSRVRSARMEDWLHWLFRLGLAMEFVGHGACGIHTKAAWLPYFRTFGISDSMAWRLMPVVGFTDAALGMAALASPRRALIAYMAVWGAFTAALRPASGEAVWECVERAYNYGIAAAFLYLHTPGPGEGRRWFSRLMPAPPLDWRRAQGLVFLLRWVVAMMLVGHGAFGAFMAKKNLLGFYEAAGLGALGMPLEAVRSIIGYIEIGLGVAALRVRAPAFFLFIFGWKAATELLYPISGASLACWEVVERGGSYVAPLGVYCLLRFMGGRRMGSGSGWWLPPSPAAMADKSGRARFARMNGGRGGGLSGSTGRGSRCRF